VALLPGLLLGDGVGGGLVDVLGEGLEPGLGGLALLLAILLLVLGEGLGESALGVESGLTALSGGLVGLAGGLVDELGVGVKLVEEGVVGEGILLLEGVLRVTLLGGLDGGLDLVGVDDAGEVSVGEEGAVEVVVLLLVGTVSEGAEDGVEALEGRGSPDDEPTELTAGGELEEIEAIDVDNLDSWDVADSL